MIKAAGPIVTATAGALLLFSAQAAATGISVEFDAAPGEKLSLHADGAKISVHGGSDDQVRVDITRRDDHASDIEDDYLIEFNQENGVITGEVKRRSRFGGWIGGWSGRGLTIEIALPEIHDLDLTTSGGSIGVQNVAGIIETRTSGGRLRFEEVDGPISGRTSGGSIYLQGTTGSADLHTSGGKITIGSVEGDIKARTSGGGISIDSAAGAIDAKTSGGSITAAFRGQPESDCSLRTSGGSINVSLDSTAAATVQAKTSGSKIHTELPVVVSGEISKTRLEGDLNGGGPMIVMRTSGGPIRLKAL